MERAGSIMGGRFLSSDYLKLNGGSPAEGTIVASMASAPQMLPATNYPVQPALNNSPRDAHEGAPTCSECGMLMVPNGACYKCENCGSTSGCS